MRNRKGQGMIEYLILVCLLSVSAIAIVSVVGANIREQYSNVSAALRGGPKTSLTAPDKSSYQMRGMDDFHESSRKGKATGWR